MIVTLVTAARVKRTILITLGNVKFQFSIHSPKLSSAWRREQREREVEKFHRERIIKKLEMLIKSTDGHLLFHLKCKFTAIDNFTLRSTTRQPAAANATIVCVALVRLLTNSRNAREQLNENYEKQFVKIVKSYVTISG